ncbi:transglycosylase domain-containing protein [Salibacterium aidingense]|uniref:transglycosylase domain-containing protein n=1 Tax=Salibacterium aidingense TaxID=384933 RepID=UPI003BDE7837
MRTAMGYLFIAGFMVVFSFFLLGLLEEEKEAKSLEAMLEEEAAIDEVSIPRNSYMYDKNGGLITELSAETDRRYIPFEDIPHYVKQAFLSTEDQHFFEHEGVDIAAVGRALAVNTKTGTIEEGASTITQQVVRNLYLSHEQSYNRKLSEVLYSYQMEKEYSKEDILEFYINSIYFQNGIYGFETASRRYFGKSSRELSLADIAFLAAIPANPEHYNPLTKKENTKLRQEWILEKMKETGAISEKEKKEAKQHPISLSYREKKEAYPDYSVYVEEELKQLIASKEGYQSRINKAEGGEKEELKEALNQRVQDVLESGIHIETSLDPVLQEHVTSTINQELKGTDVQGAAVVIDHATHRIAAMSGGRNYRKYDFNRAFQAFRQPGSAIKPLLVFGPYLDTTRTDRKTQVSSDPYCHNTYCPKNAGGGFHGYVSLETAFAQSYNTAALRLFEQTGIEVSFSYLEKIGLSKLQSSDHQLAAALGGLSHGVSPLELTRGYTVFSNQGSYTPSRAIRKVTDGNGHVLYAWSSKSRQLWEEETNQKLRHMMRSVMTEGTGRAAAIESEEWRGKTGTTNSYRDLWFVGYNQRYTAGVWLGKDQPASLQGLGPSLHLQLWKQIALRLKAENEDESY